MNKILRNALAVAAVAVCTPVAAFTVYPDIDFEWYANVGKGIAAEAYPAPRAGFIWSPGHAERSPTGQKWVAGHWIQDTYHEQVAAVAAGPATAAVYDKDGNLVAALPLPGSIVISAR